MLDCDSQPLYDPMRLFASPTFREKGSYYFPDYFGNGDVGSPQMLQRLQ